MNTRQIVLLLTISVLFFFSISSAANADDLQDAKDAFKRKDYETAYKLFLPLAEQGISDAQLNLGWMYEQGRGVSQDNQEVVKWWKYAAEQGVAQAQLNLGRMYYKGRGVPQDDQEAVKWYRIAAKQGDAQAQNYLGLMFSKGQGVPQDDQEAVKLFRLAAEQGLIESQFNLGVTYSNGRGVPQDDEKAAKWFQLAADQGDAAARERLDFLLTDKVQINNQNNSQDFQKSPEKVIGDDIKEEDADDGHAIKNYKKRFKLILPLAKKGDAEAQYNLGIMYDNGIEILKDYNEAVYWYRLAAEQGYAEGKIKIYNLAKKSVPQALNILINDAENRVTKAQNKLGEVYLEGKGLPQDYVLAHMWFNLAGSQLNEDAIRNRNTLERKMSPSQIEKAQEMARNWQKSIWEQLKEKIGLKQLKAIFKKFM